MPPGIELPHLVMLLVLVLMLRQLFGPDSRTR
jgi:hypothetical protein